MFIKFRGNLMYNTSGSGRFYGQGYYIIKYNFSIFPLAGRIKLTVYLKICCWLLKQMFFYGKSFILCFNSLLWLLFNAKTAGRMDGGSNWPNWPPCGFLKNVSSKERVKPWFFVTFVKLTFPRKNYLQKAQPY